jgi:hypothetical protein
VAPVFAVALKLTLPLAIPDVGLSVTQELEVNAFHEQPACVTTPTEPLPPAAATPADGVDTAYVQPGEAPAAACVTDTGDPAIISVVDRDVVPVFAASAYVTLPGPCPDDGDTFAQAAGLDAVQAQASLAVREIAPDPPAAPTETNVLTGTAQPVEGAGADEPAAAWFTATLLPATWSVVVRSVDDVFGEMEKLTVPALLPDAGETVTQDTGLLACQLHPAPALTPMVPARPAPDADTLVVSAEAVHAP